MQSSDEIRLDGIRSDDVATVWPVVAPLLSKAVKQGRGDYNMEDMFAALTEAKWQLWITHRENGYVLAAGCTKVKVYPSKKVCLIFAVGGERLDLWIDKQPILEAWAKENECTEMEIIGRKGWIKKLPEYEEAFTILRKKI